jgi:thiosulfate dehydrogenase [quinone] large subunit
MPRAIQDACGILAKKGSTTMADRRVVNTRGDIIVPDPPFAHVLFSTTRVAWLFLIIRLYVGYTWLAAGWGKFSGGTWVSGQALQGFWTKAVAPGSSPIAESWYRAVIQFMLNHGWYTWFAPLVMAGEILVGVALILGALTGIAALFGAFMNWNYIMAGTASTNGWLGLLAILLILAWKVAGWYGLDRWLLPLLGTPWYRGGRAKEQSLAPAPTQPPKTSA